MSIADSNIDYYHINRLVPWSPFAAWSVGDKIDIGGETNPYFRFFETQQKAYPVDNGNCQITIPGVQFIKSVAQGKINCPAIAEISSDIVTHFVAYIRELIWEQVRVSEFPHLPSRQRCIWLIPNREGIKFWIEQLGVDRQQFQIVRVRVQGRLHKGSNEHLLGDSEPMEVTLKRARQYWLGISSGDISNEILFEGRLFVQEIISPNALSETKTHES